MGPASRNISNLLEILIIASNSFSGTSISQKMYKETARDLVFYD